MPLSSKKSDASYNTKNVQVSNQSVALKCNNDHRDKYCIDVVTSRGKVSGKAICGNIKDFCQKANIKEKKTLNISIGIGLGLIGAFIILIMIALGSSESFLETGIGTILLLVGPWIGAWFIGKGVYQWRKSQVCENMNIENVANAVPKSYYREGSKFYNEMKKKGNICK